MLRVVKHALAAMAVAFIGGFAAAAPAPSVQDTVKPPAGGDYGSSSFYDGFGRVNPGFSLLEYGTFSDNNRIAGPTGGPAGAFRKPGIHGISILSEISYTSGWQPFGGDAVGFFAAVPVVDVSSHFGAGSKRDLQTNGLGIGDLSWGPLYQSRYVRAPDGRAVFAYRIQLSVLSPTGSFNAARNINQDCGYWAVNPNIAMTYVPLPKWEISGRFTYQYNFPTAKLGNWPQYRNGQAGAMVYANFDTSYKVTAKAELGFNGFAIDELGPDRTDGQIVPHSRESEVFIGPGARYKFGAANSVNFNIYLPVEAHNESAGPKFNIQYIHRF